MARSSHLDEPPLSAYGAASRTPSPVARMMAEFAADFRDGADVNLGVGYVNERTIPRRLVVEATRQVIAHPRKYDKALNYGAAAGTAGLIDAIRRYWLANRVGGVTGDLLDRKRVVVGVAGASSLLEAFAAVLKPGIAVTADPMYYIYTNFLQRAGWRVLAVPEDGQGLRSDLLAEKLAALGRRLRDVRMIYVVTVSNPTGTILSNARRGELVAAAAGLSRRLGRIVPLLLDRAYEELIHDPAVEPPRSGMLDDEAGCVYEVSTVSKVLAPALRVGYVIGPPGGLLDAVVQRVSDVGFSAAPINQHIAAFLLDRHAAGQIASVNAGYRRKALRVRRWIDERLGGELEAVTGGSAGFYFYLTFRRVETHERSAFFRFLSRTTGEPAVDGPPSRRRPRVLYLPGEHCVHPAGELVSLGRRQLRLSYGFEQPRQIAKALRLMAEAADYALSSCPGRRR